jgi:YggT family protein
MYRLINFIFSIAELIILIRAFVSWIPVSRYNRLAELLYRITEPVLSPVRNFIARIAGQNLPIDFSPIVVLILIAVLRHLVLSIIVGIA